MFRNRATGGLQNCYQSVQKHQTGFVNDPLGPQVESGLKPGNFEIRKTDEKIRHTRRVIDATRALSNQCIGS